MKTWPALDVGRLTPTHGSEEDGVGVGVSRPDLFQAALLDYDVAAVDESLPDAWRVFFHSAGERERARHDVTRDFPDLSVVPVDVPDEDWATRSQVNLRAVRVGDLLIAPPWDVPDAGRLPSADTPGNTMRLPASAGRAVRDAEGRSYPPTVVIIQPSMGFGTGHHATTRLCLAALQQLDLRGRSALDVGAGSGVLAIAANRLGASPILAIDHDPDAVQSARENVALNAGAEVDVRVDDLGTAVLPAFDVVFANLTGGLLIRSAARLQDLAAPAGRLVLSGFMKHEEAAVLGAFASFAVAYRAEEEEWLCVTLQRP